MAGHTLLFLCTGNYYRSRFAELYFNHQAAQRQLDWHAESRGLGADQPNGNIGAMSMDAYQALAKRGIKVDVSHRFPRQVSPIDLRHAHRVIALHEDEHRPMVEAQFPDAAGQVEYWRVEDVGAMAADQAMDTLARRIDALVGELAGSAD
jgi:protein-tyrosine phosphatase